MSLRIFPRLMVLVACVLRLGSAVGGGVIFEVRSAVIR